MDYVWYQATLSKNIFNSNYLIFHTVLAFYALSFILCLRLSKLLFRLVKNLIPKKSLELLLFKYLTSNFLIVLK